MYNKEKVIYQIQRDYGFTRQKAVDFFNKIDNETREEFDREYYSEAKKSFWED